jgi:phosphoenolpyruvate carboxylase
MDAAPPDALADLLARLAEAREAAAREPFGDPVLAVALAISRRIDEGALDRERIAALIARLAHAAGRERAARLAGYLGVGRADFASLAARLVRPDPEDSPVPFAAFRAAVERARSAAVFTAHPTFAAPPDTYDALAAAAGGAKLPDNLAWRPEAPTLAQEFAQATAAIARGRDALDRLAGALLDAAAASWGERAWALDPAPIRLASWVGTDTDGRTDIGWSDSFGLRLEQKRLQIARLAAQVAPFPALAARCETALAALARQQAALPARPDAAATQSFAAALIGESEAAIPEAAALDPLFAEALASAPDAAARRALAIARAGFRAHGMGLALTHFRLNATQVHNAIRQRLGLSIAPDDMAARRGALATLNAALAEATPQPVDFGALLAEQTTAARMMMTIAQIAKWVDRGAPIRFLIAESETGATLLGALWLARRFGVEDRIEISPLFETASALERGERLLEEALRSPQFRAHIQARGRLCLQFGYSDSGRYVGQLAGSYLAERLKLRLAEQLRRHGLEGVELVLFDTHGESVGRGAHPESLSDRLAYLSPPAMRASLARAGIPLREETSFQGGDGYLLFGAAPLAEAAIARIAEHAFSTPENGDPIYMEGDFGADFFATARREMEALVEDPGYAALLGAFGPGLLDRTGSRPAARQADGLGGPMRIRHPSQLRAIPNNAILQQLGFLANTLHGLGAAASVHPENFADLRHRSPRFARALGMAAHAARCSDLGVLRAAVDTLDPGSWLDRAGASTRPGRRGVLLAVAQALERLGLTAETRKMFRRLQADHIALRHAWPELPRMPDRLVLLHALRLALIHRIWLLAVTVPEFSPRDGATREGVIARILQLEIEPALALLEAVFPAAPDPAAGLNFHEPAPPREGLSYADEHAAIFAPIRELFALLREAGAAITQEVGAFG